jgi:hypothetical protein
MQKPVEYPESYFLSAEAILEAHDNGDKVRYASEDVDVK